MPPPPRPIPKGYIVIQPNAYFESEAEMQEWLANNITGATIRCVWKVEMLACTVLAPVAKAFHGKKKKHK